MFILHKYDSYFKYETKVGLIHSSQIFHKKISKRESNQAKNKFVNCVKIISECNSETIFKRPKSSLDENVYKDLASVYPIPEYG